MPTNRKRKSRKFRPQSLSLPWVHFLESGDYLVKDRFPDMDVKESVLIFQLGNPRPGGSYVERLKTIWETHKDEILRDWKKKGHEGSCWVERVIFKNGGNRK